MYTQFAQAVNDRFRQLSVEELYTTDVDLWDTYLNAYPDAENPIIKERRLYDCNTCKQFIRRLGGVVGIKDDEILTIWDNFSSLPEPFNMVCCSLYSHIKLEAKITGVFRTRERQYGVQYNYDAKTNERHDHFWAKIDAKHHCSDPEKQRGEMNSRFQVLKRGLRELRLHDFETVLDLIENNALYRGAEFKESVSGFMRLLVQQKPNDLYVWENLMHKYSLFRNTVIGTLLVDLASGVELDQAVRSFESKVAPMNYKRPTAIITQRMVEDAVKKISDLGLHGALQRRYAKLTDVSVKNVLFVDNEVKLKDSVYSILETAIKHTPPDVKHATTIPADEFIANVLPGTKKLDVFVENRHTGNFVSLTGSDDPAKIFKWGNQFGWSYDGDVTDSVKQRVKSAGGKIDCKLRVSLSWFNTDDLDLHAQVPGIGHIYFRDKMGILDVDMNAFNIVRNPVENLAFNTLSTGIYEIAVNQFNKRETGDVGFAIEVECDGELHQFNYPKALQNKETVQCFKLHVMGGKLMRIDTSLMGGNTSKEKWGIKTQCLVPVSAMMYSPNHWDQEVGAKHLIMALKGCKNPGQVRGIYNEFLRGDLESHRKVFEVLGNKTKCPASDDQISGVGFTAARGDTVTVVVDGRRAWKLTF